VRHASCIQFIGNSFASAMPYRVLRILIQLLNIFIPYPESRILYLELNIAICVPLSFIPFPASSIFQINLQLPLLQLVYCMISRPGCNCHICKRGILRGGGCHAGAIRNVNILTVMQLVPPI